MKHQTLDGHGLRAAVVAGADWVRHTRRHLNRINVFPVADGDTGTNMALSLSATAQAIRDREEGHLGDVLGQVAEASVLGAKGNSGLILAHWFQGFAESVGPRPHIDRQELAAALRAASRNVDGALENPIEGTIISVMRAAAEAADRVAEASESLNRMVESMLEGAGAALARTPDQLDVLRQANVVDAGAQGFVNFLHGVHRSLEGLPGPQLEEGLDVDEGEPAKPGHEGEIDGRYCTEMVLRAPNLDRDALRKRFAPLGSSLLVATTGALAKVHIHTDHPEAVFRSAEAVATLDERKVDDMLRQRRERHVVPIQPHLPLAQQPDQLAVLVDSANDLPQALRTELGMEVVPMQVLFGDEVFRDGVDLDHAGFYRRLAEGLHFPTTSQPTPGAFVEGLERIRPDRPVLICTVGANLSGTWESARAAARLARHPQVEVFDTRSASLGAGMLALNAARLAARGNTLPEILPWLQQWQQGAGVYFFPRTLEYLRRGGRIGRARSIMGNVLGLRPILGYHGDSVRAVSRVRHEKQALERMIELMRQELPADQRLRIGLGATTGGPLDQAETALRDAFDVVEVVRSELTGVLGAHIGPGGWGIFFQRVPEDDPLA